MSVHRRWFAVGLAVLLCSATLPTHVLACGGFFCTTVPVDQAAERVIFTMDDGTVTTYVQINYIGAAEDFAWILPVPGVPQIDTAEATTFRDLDRLTQPLYIPPRAPDCVRRPLPAAAAAAPRAEGGVTVEASGEVGPFGYHVVSSPDPQDLVRWLRENGYRITSEMEPLVKMYTDDGLIFLAMRLRQGQNARDIVPVKLTYESSLPMIPLRLTAVAATPDMPVLVWIFARSQASPINFVASRIRDSEVSFTPFGRNDYQQVVSQAADLSGGRAFFTEFAGPTTALRPPSDETAKLLLQNYPYLTRLYTRISPEEMTVDPIFDLAPSLPDQSNVHDLSSYPSPWTCSDDVGTWRTVAGSGPPPAALAAERYLQRFNQGGGPKGVLLFSLLALSAVLLLRRSDRYPTATANELGRSVLRRVSAPFRGLELTPRATSLLFLETVLLQGFHQGEHIVQMLQRSVFGIASGAGVLGSAFDIEPVHMVYNGAFSLLLGAVWVGCRRNRRFIPRNASAVVTIVGLAVAMQTFHTAEHVFKMWQYVQSGMNGTPGILGYWFPVVYLHFWYNTVIYAVVLLGFGVGGYHREASRFIATLVPRVRLQGLRSA